MSRHYVRLKAAGTFAEPVEAAGSLAAMLLEYDPADPLAVAVTFGQGLRTVKWHVSRDLLWDGLSRRTGQGDVSAWVGSDGRFYIRVSYDGQAATVAMIQAEVRDFLAKTFLSVAPGTEYSEDALDGVLASLLGTRD